jgi:predicted nucleic acid-binding protein
MLDAVRRGDLVAVMSWEPASELVAVMRRPAIGRYGVTEADIEAVLDVLGPLLPGVDIAVEVRDPDDVMVVGAALAGSAAAIVTDDRDLLDDVDLRAWLAARGVEVITPTALLERLVSRS